MLEDRGVVVITVTYGSRKSFLRAVIDAARREGASGVVVVDNGSDWPVSAELRPLYAEFVEVLSLGGNKGSAGGYAAGLEHAVRLGAEFLWLLDDDTPPATGALDRLRTAYQHLQGRFSARKLAVAAFRPSHHPDIAAGVPLGRARRRKNSFRGFHALDIPYKVWRRTRWGRPRLCNALPLEIHLPMVPYSGLLFHRSVVAAVGLPLKEFVLYGDDLEYTSRVACHGGAVVLVTNALLVELERSWNVDHGCSTSFGAVLTQGSDTRAYYSARNGAFIDTYVGAHRAWVVFFNMVVYLVILWCFALREHRIGRYWLVLQAIADGRAKKLGIKDEFPL